MRATFPAAVLAACLALSACGSETKEPAPTPGPSAASSSTPASNAQVIEVTIKDGKVTPAGERIEVEVDRPIELRVTADTEGELHVHSTPEHELEYKEGVTSLEFTIDVPGVIEVEDHTTDTVVVQLEAR